MLKQALTLVCAALTLSAVAQAEEERSWSNVADLSWVQTSGNTQTSNLSLSDKLKLKLGVTNLTVDAGILRTKTTDRVPANVAGDLVVAEDEKKTAENYRLAATLRGKVIGHATWYTSAGWEQDKLAGLDQRLSFGAGLGYTYLEQELQTAALELGYNYTDETPVEGESDGASFLRAFTTYDRTLSETAKLGSELEFLTNFDDSEDYRINWTTSITASLHSNLALKISYALKFDNTPVIEVYSADGFEDVIFEYDNTDTVLSTSLVFNF